MANNQVRPESDPVRRDEVLKRMLKMPPKPHGPAKKSASKKRRKKVTGEGK